MAAAQANQLQEQAEFGMAGLVNNTRLFVEGCSDKIALARRPNPEHNSRARKTHTTT
jgi:hypothetical protein